MFTLLFRSGVTLALPLSAPHQSPPHGPPRPSPEMGRLSGKTCRLLSMLTMTFSFFLVELIVGHVTNSLALVGDSYHMLSDVVALVVGVASVKVCPNSSSPNAHLTKPSSSVIISRVKFS